MTLYAALHATLVMLAIVLTPAGICRELDARKQARDDAADRDGASAPGLSSSVHFGPAIIAGAKRDHA